MRMMLTLLGWDIAPSLAARLPDGASPETVVVDNTTRSALAGIFALQPFRDLALKGFPHVRSAWCVAPLPGARPARRRHHPAANGHPDA